ncbi:MAG: phosphatase PAP2 family protein, partial [Porticoccus sp.]|nr:phosphatase PAP2 family protein [Porticoccus sp.]
ALMGCATTADQSIDDSHAWGSNATLFPSWNLISRAAAKAARAPQTWGPAVGAALFSATDWDKDVSDWAQRHHPVYGSQDAALTASDNLRDGAKYGAIVTALLTPNGPDATAASIGKLKGMGLQLGAYFATESATTVFKRVVARRRPNDANNRSFPSGHTSAAFAAGTLARRNVAASAFSPMTSRVLDVGFVSLGVGTSWARVEAGMHYPSDVFAGAALGHFIAAVVNDAFVGEYQRKLPRVSFLVGQKVLEIGLNWSLY